MGDNVQNSFKQSRTNNDVLDGNFTGKNNSLTNNKKPGGKFSGDSNLPTLTKSECMNFVFTLYQTALESVTRLEADLAADGVELTPAQRGYFTFNEVLGEVSRQWNVGDGGSKIVREVLNEIAELKSGGKFRNKWGLKDRT